MALYRPKQFWNETLARNFGLAGTGHGAFGPMYNEYLYRAKRRAFNRALQRTGISLSGTSVLDVGCGTGFFRTVAKQLGCASYTGFDIAPVAVASLSAAFPEDRFVQVDISDEVAGPLVSAPPFRFVLCFDVLYHITDDARFESALRNLWRLVERGGHLFLVDYLGGRDQAPGAAYTKPAGYVPHVRFRGRRTYEAALLRRDDVDVVDLAPMYALLNRPLVGDVFPWRHERLSWQIRYRLLERRTVISALYHVDGAVTRYLPALGNLKLLVARKA